MRRYVQARTARVRKLCDSEEEEKIGHRPAGEKIFPFSDLASSMPSVGTRRSTRVFVPKSVSKASDVDAGRVLRSGKRRFSSGPVAGKQEGDEDDWFRVLGNPRTDAVDLGRCKRENGWHGDSPAAECDPAGLNSGVDRAVEPMFVPKVHDDLPVLNREKMYGIVYSRKRRRSPENMVLQDRKYGIAFVRKQRRKKLMVLNQEKCKECDMNENVAPSEEKVRVSMGDNLLDFVLGRALLVVFVEYSHSSSSRFVSFLVSVLNWMRRSKVRLSKLAAFLSFSSIARVFSLHGVHFLPTHGSKNPVSCSDAFPGAGICGIFGATQFVPLVSLNFAASPSYFTSIHSSMLLRSLYRPGINGRCLGISFESFPGNISHEEHNLCASMDVGFSGKKGIFGSVVTDSGSPVVKRSCVDCAVELKDLAARSFAAKQSGRLRKHQKRRSSIRSSRVLKKSLTPVSRGGFRPELNGLMKLRSAAKVSPLQDGLMMPNCEKSLDVYGSDIFGIRDDYVMFASSRTNKQRKCIRNSTSEKFKELKLFLSDIKQNIDTLSCSANILVVESDKCWRESGAEVMLECSSSNEWMLAVKMQGSIKYLHKAQEMRPSTCNRYTHAMMWTGESGWKLEFCDRKDWTVFKELHRECCERNTQGAATVKIIPVPGVQEVFDYGDGEEVPFVRPDVYITTADDEVGRALMSEHASYDMDSGDEEWLEQLNSKFQGDESGNGGHISADDFEKFIHAFEKAAYSHHDDVSDGTKAINLCLGLGSGEMVAAIYDYWLRKRKQKKSALVRVFQGQPPKRAQLIQKPFFRKKRSFKRHASQFGRGKPQRFLQAPPKQEEIKRVQEAEQAAHRAMEMAVLKRKRAQMLMQYADLATYKSVMALRTAEAAQESTEAAPMVLG